MKSPDRPRTVDGCVRELPLAVAVALFVPAFVVVAWPWLSGAVTIPWDAKAQFRPELQFLATALAQHQSPFWTPDVFAGWPQIADPQSLIFSPLHLALAWLSAAPSFRASDAATFAALFLGGIGVILLFRDRGWHLGGAVVAALAFAFGGAAASRLQHTGEILSLAYLPLALWLLLRALERSSRRIGVAAGLACGLLAIGRDQVALLGLYVLLGAVLAFLMTGGGRRERVRASLGPLVSAGVAAALIAAVPVMMTALLAADSNRPEVDLLSAGRGSLHPAHFLTLAFADLFAAAHSGEEFWGPPSYPWGTTGLFLAQNMGQLYAGALPLVTVVSFGLVRRLLWSRDIRFFTIAIVAIILYGLGWYTPAFRVIYELLPGVDMFRRPADAAFLIGALFAVLGGYLVHRWLSGTVPAPTPVQRGLEIAIAVALAAVAIAVATSVGMLGIAVAPIATGVAFATAAVAVLWLARRLDRRPIAAVILLAAFTTFDFAWNNAPNGSTGLPPDLYDVLLPDTHNETIAILKAKLQSTASPVERDRVELIGIGYHWPNVGLVHGIEHLFGQNPLRLKAFADATGVPDTVAIPEQRTFSPLFPSYRSLMADLFGVRFIATGVPVEQIDRNLRSGDLNWVARTDDAYIYENPRALPRVLLAGSWQIADFDALIRTGAWPQFDPTSTVLLDHPPPVRLPAAGTNVQAGSVRIIDYANTVVDLEADAPTGGLVVLNDVWHPWWRASVDGAPAPILKANVLFRAVAVPPGRHRVRFEFEPLRGALDELAQKLGLGG